MCPFDFLDCSPPSCDFDIYFFLSLVIGFPQPQSWGCQGEPPRQMAVSSSGIGGHAHCPIRDKQREGETFFVFFFLTRMLSSPWPHVTILSEILFGLAALQAVTSRLQSAIRAGVVLFQSEYPHPEGKGETPYSIKRCYLILLFCCQSFGVMGRKMVGVFCLWGPSLLFILQLRAPPILKLACGYRVVVTHLSGHHPPSPDSPDITVTPPGSSCSAEGLAEHQQTRACERRERKDGWITRAKAPAHVTTLGYRWGGLVYREWRAHKLNYWHEMWTQIFTFPLEVAICWWTVALACIWKKTIKLFFSCSS